MLLVAAGPTETTKSPWPHITVVVILLQYPRGLKVIEENASGKKLALECGPLKTGGYFRKFTLMLCSFLFI